MLRLVASLLNQPVLSLRTGSPVAFTEALIINPNNLKIEGFYVRDRVDKTLLVLLAVDIRDFIPDGIVIDDHGALAESGDLIRLKDILNLRFTLLNKLVITEGGKRVGKINDFATDQDSLYIQKLYVNQNIIKHFTGGQMLVDRSQIVEISDKTIVIQDLENYAKNGVPAPVAPA